MTLSRRTPLRRTAWNPVRTPLRQRSKKTANTYIKRRALVARLLEQRRICEARWDEDCSVVTVDVHEILPRSQGGRIVDAPDHTYLVVCRYCHDKIEANPQQAHDRGFRRWSWEGEPQ